MTKIRYAASSPYSITPQTSWYIGNLKFRPIPADSGDQPFTLLQRHQYRPDRLAYELYTSPAYWWVFCVRNAFLRRDPVWAFTVNLQITVPASDYLHRLLGG